MYKKIQEAVAYLQSKSQKFEPQIGVILGTGLGAFRQEIEVVVEISYNEIPYFAESTVESHAGKLIFGYFQGIPIVAMAGRFHYYEGYSMEEVTFPVRVLKYLNIERLIISNAAGGVQAHLYPGDIVFIKDHINLHAQNPLRGKNDARLGVRFPDMLKTYDVALNQKAIAIAQKNNIRAFEGVYVGTQGPNLETPAEYNFFNIIGGDVVGMSTIPEVLVAKHMELPVFVVSVVSNRCFPIDEITETTVEEVIEVVQQTESKLTLILKELLAEL
ncbi:MULTISPECIES: purine-nucleoside phosphorylase [unclassified Aureispira]|uniref:purine-nucleoside phosphorylase n=1 Tax=unclassified Aureispira TaxID=2649989 RepID=UPI000AE3FB45|nr:MULTISPECIES: purine-nucleoside phosphorylase [unclassified Aureispira]WMX14657.1 purine-nucleoside phosphorylase [Aureispira sp. CCB-E]